MAKKQVQPGSPPLIWSSVEKAFRDVNANFDELYSTVGGGTVVDFSSLFTDVSPGANDEYSLGGEDNRWKSLFVAAGGSGDTDGEALESNGIHIGPAQIRGLNNTVDLPANATVDGELIIDPDKTFFKSFQVDNENSIVADQFVDSLNFISGTALKVSVDSTAESIIFDNTGVTRLSQGAGIIVSSNTGDITVTNAGVLSLANSSSLAASPPYTVGAVGRTPGTGIAVDTATGNPTLTSTGVMEVQDGFGITVSTDAATGIVTVQNSAPAQPAFGRIRLLSDTFGINDIVADATTDQLTIDAGYGLNVATLPASDTIQIALNQNIDIIGSVFGDNSTLLVNGVDGVIPAENLQGTGTIDIIGNTIGYHIGDVTGSVFADDSSLLVDGVAGTIPGTLTGDYNNPGNIFSIIGEGLSVNTGDTTLSITDGGIVFANSENGDNISLSLSGVGLSLAASGSASLAIANDINISTGNNFAVSTSGAFTLASSDITIASGNIAANSFTGDLTGSVFADDSTTLLDGVNGIIKGNVENTSVLTSELAPLDGVTLAIRGDIITIGNDGGLTSSEITIRGNTSLENTLIVAVTNVPSTSKGQLLDKQGMVAFDSSSIYYCIADYTTGSADIWVKQDWGTTGAW